MHAIIRQLFTALLFTALQAHALEGTVVDAASGRPLEGAQVVAGSAVVRSDAQGRFSLPDAEARGGLSARAPGYRRLPISQPLSAAQPLRVALVPFRPKALYLSPYGIGDGTLRAQALQLIEHTELNALVIDVKGDRGIVPFPSAAYAAAGIGAQTPITVRDMAALVASLHERGIYLIARVVVFKDDRLADAHPAWAVHDKAGAVWHDREGLSWIDPMQHDAWAFSLAVAEEAAQLGFDEVQFDYLRFPDAAGLHFAAENTQAHRVAAINAYLDAAQARLARHNVFVSADVFGYICWNEDDTQIGQDLETIVERVDYLSPILYPSGFSFGIPGHRQPVAEPYAIVEHSLRKAMERTGLGGVRWRPWLQAFRDYAFDRRAFDGPEVRAQIDAAEAVGSDGWMLWNAHNVYSADGLKPAGTATVP
jgi:hypothetical protein